MSPFVGLALLTPQKDDFGRMYIHNCAISKIIIHYRFLYLDLITCLIVVQRFSKIDLRSEYHQISWKNAFKIE